MSFSNEWEIAYQNNTNLSIWPWSDLVSMFYHTFPESKYDYEKMNVLELGCGAGANIPFFESLGVNYYSVEGSISEVKILKEKYESDKIHIEQGDFSRQIPFGVQYDLIFDRASVSHNETSDIKQLISQCYELLLPTGYYIGVDWFATDEKEYVEKIDILKNVDERTFQFCGNGKYANLGNVHFTNESEIREVFSKYTPIEITKKTFETTYPNNDTSVHWNFIMKKENRLSQ